MIVVAAIALLVLLAFANGANDVSKGIVTVPASAGIGIVILSLARGIS